MNRYAYGSVSGTFLSTTDEDILGCLAQKAQFDITLQQRTAWIGSIWDIRKAITNLDDAHVFLEFVIPRMGRRADCIIIFRGCVFVIEYKIGSALFHSTDIDQVLGYALDLKNFHEPSHNLPIVPVLVATEAITGPIQIQPAHDLVCSPIMAAKGDLSSILILAAKHFQSQYVDPDGWVNGRYKPTPTIIEAAQALYRNHNVDEITRNEAGAENLSATAMYVSQVIDNAKANSKKAICLITGVPGAGKTLAGLNIANLRTKIAEDEHAVFLSGNGPLVKVLQAALIEDQRAQAKADGVELDVATSGRRSVAQFIQNIHHFRDANLDPFILPIEKVAIFDEAQRAWDNHQTSKFMRERGVTDFDMSEPQFLLSVMNRHKDWCVVICLVGHGQEINTGEAGLSEWLNACKNHFPEWQVHASTRLLKNNAEFGLSDTPSAFKFVDALHLSTSIRSFRSEAVSDFVAAMIENNPIKAKCIHAQMGAFEFVLTRELPVARQWLRNHRRGSERSGLLAFSNSTRLKPEGVFVKNEIDPVHWFLKDRKDTRSSDYLEDVATEFAVQGLELDWACVCIDANLRHTPNGLVPMSFKGTRWQSVNDPARQRFILNAHRVLLTRARQGVIIFVPRGDENDPTREPKWYDGMFEYLQSCGIRAV